MSRNLTQKLKQSLAKNKQTKISFNASLNVQDLINDYLRYYSDIEAEKITLDLLLSSIIESVLNGDKEFQKWRRDAAQNPPDVASKVEP
jgi:hypothetical protein